MAAIEALAPGATIGILGGGQLGRMLALAAAPLGLRTHVFCPEADSPAAQVSPAATVAAYDDREALARFAAACDVITYEFENIPAETAAACAAVRPLRPGLDSLRTTQDRLHEKRLCEACSAPVAAWRRVDEAADLPGAVAALGLPAILKSRRFGYDGKGQARIEPGDHPRAAWAVIGTAPAILERVVPFEREISVLLARTADGAVAAWPPVENRHEDHILRTSRVPASIADATAQAASRIAVQLAHRLEHVGVLAVELFVLPDGAVLVNELAPRVHNSGHWTIEGAATSQFEQHLRAICGWPLGATDVPVPVEMTNLLGVEVDAWVALAAEPGARLHLYGKGEARPGRKMGHVTRLRR